MRQSHPKTNTFKGTKKIFKSNFSPKPNSRQKKYFLSKEFICFFQLKESKSDKTVVAFLIFPTKTNSFNVDTLRGHAVAKGLEDTIDEIQKDVGRRMYEIALRGQVPDPNELLSKNDLIRIKRCIYAQGAGSLPPITTHNIVDDNLDPIMNAFRRCQLFNNHHD